MPWNKTHLPDAVKGQNWNDAEVETFVTTANLALENSKSEVEAIEAGMAEVKNNRSFPRFFYARHMHPGLAGYKDETILVDGDAIKNMLASLSGKPIYINHQNVDLTTMKNQAAGYIADSFWNELDGWAWAKMLLIDDEAQAAAASGGWSVSNAYVPTEWSGGGMNNNVPYDRSIKCGEFTQLAIVQDPRYEEAKIYTPEQFKAYQESKRQQLNELKNSKEEKSTMSNPLNMFKKVFTKEATTEVSDDAFVELKNAKGEVVEVKVKDMIDTVLNAKSKKNEDDESKEKMNENTEVSVGDEKMSLGELMNRYSKMNSDAEAEKAKENEAEAEKEKQNAKDKADKDAAAAAAAEKAKGDEHFKELQNANKNLAVGTATVDTHQNKVQRGKSRYGSGN